MSLTVNIDNMFFQIVGRMLVAGENKKEILLKTLKEKRLSFDNKDRNKYMDKKRQVMVRGCVFYRKGIVKTEQENADYAYLSFVRGL